MTPEQLQAIEDRWAKATPGPWKAYEPELSKKVHKKAITTFSDVMQYGAIVEYKDKNGKGDFGGMIILDLGGGCCEDMQPRDYENAIAIASAPTDIRDLLAEVERLKCCGNCLIQCGHEYWDGDGPCKCDKWEAAE